MLLDAALHIVVDPCAYDEAILRAAVHGLGIDVIFLLVILHEPPLLLEIVEILHGLVVDGGVMLVETGSEVDFGLDDVIEGFLVAFGLFAGLFGIEHVIGAGSDLLYEVLRRAYALEGFYSCHCLV